MGRNPAGNDDAATQTTLDEALLVTDGGEVEEDPDDELEDELDATTDRLVDAGPEDARTILPQAQAETLVARDLRGWGRERTGEALDVSVYTIDDRLRRARENIRAVDALTRVLDDLDLFDTVLDDDDPDPFDLVVDEDPQSDEEPVVDEVALGDVLDVESVTKVTRSPDGSTVSVDLREPSEEDVDAVNDVLGRLGYEEFGSVAGGTVTTLRGRLPQDPDEAAQASLSEVDDEDTTDERDVLLLGGEPVPAETSGLAEDVLDEVAQSVAREVDVEALDPGSVLGTLTLDGNTWEFDAADPTPRDLDDDLRSVVSRDESAVERVETDATDEADVDEGPQSDDESDAEAYVCEDCGDSFDTPGGLGGHRKYCDARDDVDA